MWWAWSFLPALVLLSELSVVRVQTAPCQTCRKLTESFIKVLENLHVCFKVSGASIIGQHSNLHLAVNQTQ